MNQQERIQKLSEKYQLQCLQFFQEILNLQVEVDLRDKKIEELELKLAKLEVVETVDNEEIDVNATSST